MQESTVATLAKIMKSISHPIRLKILCLLVDEGQTVGQIHERLSTSYANVSQHLQRLQNQGLVVTVKQANFVHYSIASPKVSEMIRTLRRLYCGTANDNKTSSSPKPKTKRSAP